MEVATLGFRTDVAIRVAEGAQVTDRGDYLVVRSRANPAYWWGNFILLGSVPAAADAAGWLGVFAAEFPEARHRSIGLDVPDAADVDPGLLGEIQIDRSVVLTSRTLTDPARPNRSAVYRPLSGNADWEQMAELTHICADPPVTDPAIPEQEPDSHSKFVQRRVVAKRRLTETGHGEWFGAFLHGVLVSQLGLIWPIGPGLARYQDVETHPDYRRQGLAGSLVRFAGQCALDQGADQLVIQADPDYHALRLYESLGFLRIETLASFAGAC